MAEYIDRGALLDAIRAEEEKHEFSDRDVLCGMYLVEQLVHAAPAVGVEPVLVGRWITEPEHDWAVDICPFCHRRYRIRLYDWKACPNCGARLEVGPR